MKRIALLGVGLSLASAGQIEGLNGGIRNGARLKIEESQLPQSEYALYQTSLDSLYVPTVDRSGEVFARLILFLRHKNLETSSQASSTLASPSPLSCTLDELQAPTKEEKSTPFEIFRKRCLSEATIYPIRSGVHRSLNQVFHLLLKGKTVLAYHGQMGWLYLRGVLLKGGVADGLILLQPAKLKNESPLSFMAKAMPGILSRSWANFYFVDSTAELLFYWLE